MPSLPGLPAAQQRAHPQIGTRALAAGALALGLLSTTCLGLSASAFLAGCLGSVLARRPRRGQAIVLLLLGWAAGSLHGARFLGAAPSDASPRWVEGLLRFEQVGLPGRRGLRGCGWLRTPLAAPGSPRDLEVEVQIATWFVRQGRDPVPGSVWHVAGRIGRKAGRRVRLEIPRSGVLRRRHAGSIGATWIREARHALDARLERGLRWQDRGLLRALLLGDRARLTYRDRMRMRRTGQAHLLAVSGLHVALMAAGLSLLLSPLRLRPAWHAGLVLAAVYLHVHLAGCPPSAVRAGVGVALLLLCRWTGRTVSGTDILAALVLLVFLLAPTRLGDPALQLSLLAIAGILLLTPAWRTLLMPPVPRLPGLPRPRSEPWRLALAAGLGAWCATAPLVATRLGQLTLLGAPMALLCMPWVTLLMILGVAQLALCDVPVLGHGLQTLIAGLADALRGVLDLIVLAGLGAVDTAPPSTLWIGAWLGSLIALVSLRPHATRVGALGVLVLATIARPPLPAGSAEAPTYDASPFLLRGEPVTALPLAITSALLALFAVLAVRPPLRFLTGPAATAAALLGILVAWRFGFIGLGALFAPFVVASLLGRLPGGTPSPPRSVRQVAANGAPAALGALLHLLGAPVAGAAMCLGGLAALGADTCATEIGTRYGGTPRRLLRREALAPGMSGGVTRLGFLGALGGSILAPGVAMLGGMPLGLGLVLAACGFCGALIDSALGDSVQYRGLDPETGALTELRWIHGERSKPYSGYPWLDNDGVNLVAGLAAGTLAALLIAGLRVGS